MHTFAATVAATFATSATAAASAATSSITKSFTGMCLLLSENEYKFFLSLSVFMYVCIQFAGVSGARSLVSLSRDICSIFYFFFRVAVVAVEVVRLFLFTHIYSPLLLLFLCYVFFLTERTSPFNCIHSLDATQNSVLIPFVVFM